MITTKTTKKGLVEFIKESAPKLTGKKLKSLADQVAYTMKKFGEDANQVFKDDLLLLAQDIQTAIGVPEVAPVENSLKSAVKKVEEPAPAPAPVAKKPTLAKKAAETDTDKAVEKIMNIIEGGKSDKPKLAPKGKSEPAPAEKPVEKKKASLVKSKTPPASDKAVVLAEQFPAEFTAEGVGKLKSNMEIKTMKDLFDAVQAGKSLVFGMYWSARHLKQFPYDTYAINSKKFKEFPNDLDLSQLVYVSEEHKVAYAVSAYSEVVYSILPNDLEIQDGMRYTNGIEYNIYEVIE